MNAESELIDILDPVTGEPTGRKGLKDEIKAGGWWHRVVNLWIVRPDGQIFLHRRPDHLRYFAGLWATIGGHVRAGEDAWAGLLRETEEELGWRPPQTGLRHLATDRSIVPWKGIDLKVFRELFLYQGPVDEAAWRPDPREVAGYAWFEASDLRQRYEAGDPALFPLPPGYLAALWAALGV